MPARILTPETDGVETAQAVCDECDWRGREGRDQTRAASSHDQYQHPEAHEASRAAREEAARAAKRARNQVARGTLSADELPGAIRWQEGQARRAEERQAAAAQGRLDNQEIARQHRAERAAAQHAARLSTRSRGAGRSGPRPPAPNAPLTPAGGREEPRPYARRPLPRPAKVDRFPRTVPTRARQLQAGDVLVIERGLPLSVLEVEPAKSQPELLVAQVRSVEGGRSWQVGPFLPDQIVQRAARR